MIGCDVLDVPDKVAALIRKQSSKKKSKKDG